jgi:hypothetical protein
MNTATIEPRRGLPRLLFKLRQGGPRWLAGRIALELRIPSTPPGRLLHAFLRSILNAAAAFRSPAGEVSGDTLVAFYDLSVEPVTFDVLWFLAAAELDRRRRGFAHLRLCIVPGPADGLREEDPEYERVIDASSRRWRVSQILVAAADLLPSCRGVSVLSAREEAAGERARAGTNVYPQGYQPQFPVGHRMLDCMKPEPALLPAVPALRAGEAALRYVKRWLEPRARGRHVIAITLREYGYKPDRNSNISEWIEFTRWLDRTLYYPVLVPDTERAPEPRDLDVADAGVFHEAPWNLALRMALYETAWLNIGVSTGPMSLCWLNSRCRYVTVKLVTPSVPQSSVEFFEENGFQIGQPLPFAGPHQALVWKDDTLPHLKDAFADMARRLAV